MKRPEPLKRSKPTPTANPSANRFDRSKRGERSANEPTKLVDLLGAITTRYGLGRASERDELERAWASVTDERIRRATAVGSLKRGTLEIIVKTAILHAELESFGKEELLEKMRAILKGVKVAKLRFRKG